MIREKTVCFSGHRTQKFARKGVSLKLILPVIKSMLYYQIQRAAEEGFEYFLSGMANGVDLWAAGYVLDLKEQYPNLKLICVQPYAGQPKEMKGSAIYEYENIINSSDKVICLSDHYTPDCYKNRNYYMVDNSSRLIAVVGNYHSGTGQTINYARKKSLDICLIDTNQYYDAADIISQSKEYEDFKGNN